MTTIRRLDPQLEAMVKTSVLLAAKMAHDQQVADYNAEEAAWASSVDRRRGWRAAVWLLLAAALVLWPMLACFAKGERELVTVLAAKVRAGIAKRGEQPDRPPNVRVRNAAASTEAGAEPVSALVSLLEYRSLEAEVENNELSKVNKQLAAQVAELQKRVLQDDPPPAAGLPATPPPLRPVDQPPPSLSLLAPTAAIGPGEHYRIVMLTQESCAPCRVLAREIGDGFTEDGARVDVVPVDVVNSPSAVPPAYRGREIQTPLLAFDAADGDRFIGWPTNRSHIVRMLRKHKAKQTAAVAASGAAGSVSGVRQRVVDGMEWWSDHVHGPVTWTWDSNRNSGRNDGFSLLRARSSDYTSDRIYGTFGSFSLRCPAGIEMNGETFEQLDINYRSVGTRMEITTAFAIDKALIAPGESVAAYGSASGPCKVIDPATAMTIFGILRGIWSLCHPELDLQLPGRMSATISVRDGSFLVDFDGAPRLRAKLLWEWMLEVDWVTVGPTKAHVEFVPQNYWIPVRSREFAVN